MKLILASASPRRAEVLRDSRRDNREEIRRGMEWLGRLARSEPVVTEVLG